MNKQEIEQKLEEIISYSKQRNILNKQHMSDELLIAKEAFNLALNVAAESAQIDGYLNLCKEDKESILKYKL